MGAPSLNTSPTPRNHCSATLINRGYANENSLMENHGDVHNLLIYGRRSSRQGCNPAGESPTVSVARVGYVVMPHPGAGNQPGYAWCKRPGRPKAKL